MEAHGGRIKIESKENEGTTVLIYFKRKVEDQTFINSYEKISSEYN